MATPAAAHLNKAVAVAAAALAAVAVAFLAWPSGIEPAAWTPTPVRAGVTPEQIRAPQRIAEELEGPAFLATGPEDHLLTGLVDGRVAMVEGEDGRTELEVAGYAPGRPMGVTAGFGEAVVAAAADRGLVAAVEGRLIPLASEAQERPFRYVADVAISFARGQVYFTDASDHHPPAQSWAEFVEHGARGRLLAFDANRHTTEVLADGLHFPFGIALAPDESYVLICEMTEYRVLRHWLAGARKGATEVFADGLPGYPAEISGDGEGGWWLSIYAPRIEPLDRLAGQPWLRALWFKLPRAWQPQPQHRTWVLRLDAGGRVTRDLRADGPSAYAPVIGVLAREGALYLGSPTERGILKLSPGASP